MDTNRWKATVVLSSDHAGIQAELGALETALLETLARIDDPRKVRDFLRAIQVEIRVWCRKYDVDTRGWLERFKKRAG